MDSVRIHRPPRGVARLLYDSPHSGRYYPPDFATIAQGADLRRGEDAYVDELLHGATRFETCVLEATYPRVYIDVNRAETDVDVGLLAEPWDGPLAPTEKSARGLGLIRRYVTPGVEVNARLLTAAEVRERIDRVYRPYHRALASLTDEIRRAHGVVWHVNWHSMKSVGNTMTPDGAGAARADYVVSDRDGTSANPDFTAFIVEALRDAGATVSVNDPYKGGTIIQRLGSPATGVHSVQVEINRRLYLDETRVEKTAGFGALQQTIDALTKQLVHWSLANT